MSTKESDWDLEAAEYVLGTQSEENKRVYDALYKVDPDWQQRVHYWQSQLNSLHASTSPVQPPRRVLANVLDRIGAAPVEAPSTAAVSEMPVTHTHAPLHINRLSDQEINEGSSFSQTLEQWRERARYWQLTSLVAVVAMAGLILIGPDYVKRNLQESAKQARTVAVLQGYADEPLWAISSSDQGTVTVSVMEVPEPISAEQSHHLWMVLPDGAGIESVGELPDTQGDTVTLELPIALNLAAEFAVSLAPSGEVTEEPGEVIYQTFIVEALAQ